MGRATNHHLGSVTQRVFGHQKQGAEENWFSVAILISSLPNVKFRLVSIEAVPQLGRILIAPSGR